MCSSEFDGLLAEENIPLPLLIAPDQAPGIVLNTTTGPTTGPKEILTFIYHIITTTTYSRKYNYNIFTFIYCTCS